VIHDSVSIGLTATSQSPSVEKAGCNPGGAWWSVWSCTIFEHGRGARTTLASGTDPHKMTAACSGAGDIWDGSNIWALAEHGFVRVSARGRGSGSGCSRIQIAAADKAESTAARARRADARCVHSPSKTVPTNGKPPTDDVEDEGLWTIGTHLFTAILSRAEEEASHKL